MLFKQRTSLTQTSALRLWLRGPKSWFMHVSKLHSMPLWWHCNPSSVRLKGFTACSIGFSEVALGGHQDTNQRLLTGAGEATPFVSQDLKVFCKHFRQVNQCCGKITHGNSIWERQSIQKKWKRTIWKWQRNVLRIQELEPCVFSDKNSIIIQDLIYGGYSKLHCRSSARWQLDMFLVFLLETKEKHKYSS